jgi:hypothetical protein
MPGFLLKRIQTLQRFQPDVEIFVVEYQNLSNEYVVQKNQILNLIPKENFFSLSENKLDLIDILKNKHIDIVHVDDMVEEDRQAVLIFLRNTAFGSEYKMIVTDPKTDKEFTFMADLSTLKIKDFKLEPDSNGEYKYLMKKSNVDITFKFLTKKNELEIDKIRDSWNGNGVAPIITKQLEFMIKSVAGNKDPMNIRNFIERLPIKDSQDFRKYISENKPALDLTQKIMTPSGEEIQVEIGFGVEFFRPFYGI